MTETWLKSYREPEFINYSKYLCNRDDDSTGGGIAILVRNDLMHCKKDLSPFNNGKLEIQAITIRSYNTSIDIFNIYNPNEDISKDEFAHYFSQLGDSYVITGDFNAHNHMWNTHHNSNATGRNLVDAMTNFSRLALLTPQNLPTYYHIPTKRYSTLDLTFVSINLFPMSSVFLAEEMGSDHEPLWTKIAFKPQLIQGKRRPRWKFDTGSWDEWKASLPQISTVGDLTEDVSNFQQAIFETGSKIFQSTKEHINIKYSQPWWTQECAQVTKEKHKARNKFRKHPTEQNYQNFKSIESRALTIIDDAKIKSFREFCNSITSETPLKLIWKRICAISKKYKPQTPTFFNINDTMVTEPENKSNVIADLYEKTFTCKDRQKRNTKYILPLTLALVDDSEILYNQNFNLNELNVALSALKSTTPGHDRIHNKMLERLPYQYKVFLLDIFNQSFISGKVPQSWKLSIVLPILKGGKLSTRPESYRPISLLPCCGKLMERLIFNRINYELESNKRFRASQGGFRKRLCTLDQIMILENDIRYALASKQILIAVFIDLSKAFDSVWHMGVLYKLQLLGIKGRMLRWIKDYLNERKFKVYFEGAYSSERPISSGVPQGAILSPLLFNVFTSDLPIGGDIKSTEYADDIVFYCLGQDIAGITAALQRQLDVFEAWTKEWGLEINVLKTKAMIFTNRKVNPLPLLMNDMPIEFVKTQKYLGLTLDSPKLLWESHIQELRDSSIKRVNVLKAISANHWGADKTTLMTVYKALIRSRLDYGSIFYDTAAQTHTSKLDKVQNQSLRIITGAQATSPIVSLEVEANIPPLNIHRIFILLKYYSRILELPTEISTSQVLSKTLQTEALRPWSGSHFHPPVTIRAKRQFERLNLNLAQPNPVPLISPLYPSFNLDQYINTEFSTVPVKNITETMAHQIFHSIDEDYQSFIKIYTDGSKISDPIESCGAGLIIRKSETTEMLNFRLPPEMCILTCELFAINEALKYIIAYDGTETNFIIYTDSLSSLRLLKGQNNVSYLTMVYKIYHQMILLTGRGVVVHFQFIPGHKNIQGNELADHAANAAHDLEVLPNKVPKEDKVRVTNKAVLRLWQKTWDETVRVTNKGKHLKLFRNNIGHWPWSHHKNRAVETVLAKLRIGHANFREHSFRFNLSPTPYCDCGRPEDIDHIFLRCPLYNTERDHLRQNLNSINVPLTKKNLLGGGSYGEAIQMSIVEYIASYLTQINKLYSL